MISVLVVLVQIACGVVVVHVLFSGVVDRGADELGDVRVAHPVEDAFALSAGVDQAGCAKHPQAL